MLERGGFRPGAERLREPSRLMRQIRHVGRVWLVRPARLRVRGGLLPRRVVHPLVALGLAAVAGLAAAQPAATGSPPADAPRVTAAPAAASAPSIAQPLAADPALEARVLAIATELRCLVCQNETIAASHADLAVDLRRQIRRQLTEGRSERQILDYMVDRYGDFVLYRPPLKTTTLLLWAGPFALLLLGAAVAAFHIRRRRRAVAKFELSPAEEQRARALLDASTPPNPLPNRLRDSPPDGPSGGPPPR